MDSMEEGSGDSSISRRMKRRSDFEIYFGETPAFSDSEEEAEFLRMNYPQTPNPDISNSLSKNTFESSPNKLSKEIQSVACGQCMCCRKILDTVANLPLNDLSQTKTTLNKRTSTSKKIAVNSDSLISSTSSNQKRKMTPIHQGEDEITDKHLSVGNDSFEELLVQLEQVTKKSRKMRVKPRSADMDIQKENIEHSKKPRSRHYQVKQRLDFTSEGSCENDGTVTKKGSKSSQKTKKSRRSKKEGGDNLKNDKPRSSSRPLQATKFPKFHEEPTPQISVIRRSPLRKQIVYSKIDSRIFKISVDTSRGIPKTIAKKLARTGGLNLSLANMDYKCQANKMKKLYCPNDWVNSKVFSQICEQ